MPATPNFLQQVTVEAPGKNEDPADSATRYRAALGVANRIILRARGWYAGVVKDYANPAPTR